MHRIHDRTVGRNLFAKNGSARRLPMAIAIALPVLQRRSIDAMANA